MTDIIWDIRPLYVYSQTPKDRFVALEARYTAFLKTLDAGCDPITVFDPLREKQMAELQLIREVTQVLQAKKEEDIRKSQATAEEDKEHAEEKKAEEQNKVETTQEKKED